MIVMGRVCPQEMTVYQMCHKMIQSEISASQQSNDDTCKGREGEKVIPRLLTVFIKILLMDVYKLCFKFYTK